MRHMNAHYLTSTKKIGRMRIDFFNASCGCSTFNVHSPLLVEELELAEFLPFMPDPAVFSKSVLSPLCLAVVVLSTAPGFQLRSRWTGHIIAV